MITSSLNFQYTYLEPLLADWALKFELPPYSPLKTPSAVQSERPRFFAANKPPGQNVLLHTINFLTPSSDVKRASMAVTYNYFKSPVTRRVASFTIPEPRPFSILCINTASIQQCSDPSWSLFRPLLPQRAYHRPWNDLTTPLNLRIIQCSFPSGP